MPHPFCDGNGIEARINQQADVAMMDVVDAYALYSAGRTATAYLMVQIRFCEREDTVIFCKMQCFDIGCHFVGIEVRHKDTADAFLCLWRRNNILAFDDLKGFGDMDYLSFKIKVCRS